MTFTPCGSRCGSTFPVSFCQRWGGRLTESLFDRIRVLGNHGEKGACGSFRLAMALLPVLDGIQRETEFCRELSLGKLQLGAKLADVCFWNQHVGNTSSGWLSFCPRKSLIGATN